MVNMQSNYSLKCRLSPWSTCRLIILWSLGFLRGQHWVQHYETTNTFMQNYERNHTVKGICTRLQRINNLTMHDLIIFITRRWLRTQHARAILSVLPCKAKRQYLLILQVNRYYIMALQSRVDLSWAAAILLRSRLISLFDGFVMGRLTSDMRTVISSSRR